VLECLRYLMSDQRLVLSMLDEELSIAQISADSELPRWALESDFFAITRTDGELSIVCKSIHVPGEVKSDTGWRAIRLHGPFEFSLTGILSGLLNPLAAEKISIFAISTYSTDYVLVKSAQVESAVAVLKADGYQFEE